MAAVLVTVGLAYLLWFMFQDSTPPMPLNTPLTQAVNACDEITEKAALALPPPVVEFQKLEYAGRKARVFRLCMHDRGYQENAVWVRYATPLAKQRASSQQISTDEAIESLRRADMLRLAPAANAPEYWQLIVKPSLH